MGETHHDLVAKPHKTSDPPARTDARHLPTEHIGQVVLWMFVQHASNLLLHQLLEELATEGGVHLRIRGGKECD